MKSSWICICLALLLSFTAVAQELNIVIDAEKDDYYNTLTGPGDGWVWIPWEAFNDNGTSPPVDNEDLSANWYSAWDEDYLYIYEEVSDDIVNQNSTTWYQNDCIDAKIDPDPFEDDPTSVFTFTIGCMDSADVDPSLYAGVRNLYEGWYTEGRPTPEDYARKLTDTGYVLELRLQWEWIETATKGPAYPDVGELFGFAIMNHDNDSNTRDGSIEWAARLTDAVWNNCTYLGYIELLDDHKIAYVPENLIDPLIYNDFPEMYIPPGTGVSEKASTADNFALIQNYPNPFNPTTTISYILQKPSKVKISVYGLLGQEVGVLANGMKSAGRHTVQFDGANLTSGIYFYKLETSDQVITRKMTLLK